MKGISIGIVLLAGAALAACGGESGADAAEASAESRPTIPGPFPAKVRGTISYSFPLEDGSDRIKLGLLEYDSAAILISTATYDAQGLDEEDEPEVALTVEPTTSSECDADEQCLKGY